MNSEKKVQENAVVFCVGSQSLAGFLGKAEAGTARVEKCVLRKNPEGFLNGFVTDLDRAIASLESVMEELIPGSAKQEEEIPAFVVLENSKLRTYTFSSSQYYQGAQRTITQQEVRSVVDQTRSVATLPMSEFILQALPESFVVNDLEGVQNPIGLEAQRLGVDLKIHTMNFQDFKNLSKVFEAVGIRVQGYYPKTLTLSEAVLTPQEKEEGVMLVDLAEDCTQLVLWKDGNLIATRTLTDGCRKLCGEMAQTWEIDFHDAVRVKTAYGSWISAEHPEELIPLVERNGKGQQAIRRGEFQEKFWSFSKVWMADVLEKAGAFGREHNLQHPHFVFSGTMAVLDGFSDFLQNNFSQTGRIGLIKKIDAPQELLMDPALAGSLGMYRWLATQAADAKKHYAPQGFVQRTLANARDWFFAYF